MFILILNSSNIVQDGKNSSLVYNFPNSVVLKDKYIAVSQIIAYYSWFNIQKSYNNNIFYYWWTVGGVSTKYTVEIPDGLYDIKDINAYLQWVMINNGHYLINAGENVYYVEFIVNPNRYAIQLNTFLVPTALPTGFTQPANFAGYPTVSENPKVDIPINFSSIVGYIPIGGVDFSSNPNINNAYTPPTPATAATYYATKDGAGTLSYLSNTAPNVQPNSSVYVSISNINNPYSQPSSIIYAITPTVGIGEQVVETPPNFMWNKLIDGTYNQLRVQLLGIDKQPLTIQDPNMTIMLTIRDRDETMVGLK